MKTTVYFWLLCVGMLFSSHAQTIDISTGTSAPGTLDPHWTLRIPNSNTFVPVRVTTGVLSNGQTLYPDRYAKSECGQWLSPETNAENHIVSINGTSGTYTYRMEFEVEACLWNPTALLDVTAIAADNSVSEMRINGVSQPVPEGIGFLSTTGFSLNPTLINGTNILEIDVDNISSYTGLMVCGSLTIEGENRLTPNVLDCCPSANGQVISWNPIPGAQAYEVSVIWGDGECCSLPQKPNLETFTISQTTLVLPSDRCFSWFVRAVYSNGCSSEASTKVCGCFTPLRSCEPPLKLTCTRRCFFWGLFCRRTLTWTPVSGAANYELEITYNDSECCPQASGKRVEKYRLQSTKYTVLGKRRCFSWRVRSVCEDGTYSEWSVSKCACDL